MDMRKIAASVVAMVLYLQLARLSQSYYISDRINSFAGKTS